MAAINLHNTVADLINHAKLVSDAQEKVYCLEQVKEIFLHRADAALIQEFLPTITDFTVERSSQVRKFLVSFGGEIIAKFPLHIPTILTVLSNLVGDSSDAVVRAVATEMTRHYGKIAQFLVSMPTVPKTAFYTKNKDFQDPKDLWLELKNIENLLIAILSSDRVDNVRVQCLRFTASSLLFGIPSYSAHHNVSAIPLHHGFLSRVEVEEVARALMSKLLIWAKRGGPQGFPFTPEQMTELGIALARVLRDRAAEVKSMLPAITSIISGFNDKSVSLVPKELFTSFIDIVTELSTSKDIESSLGLTDGGDSVLKKFSEAIELHKDSVQASQKKNDVGGAERLKQLFQMDEEAFSDEETGVGDAESPLKSSEGNIEDSSYRKRPRPAENEELAPSGSAVVPAAIPIETIFAEDLHSFISVGQKHLCTVSTSHLNKEYGVQFSAVSADTADYLNTAFGHLTSVISAGYLLEPEKQQVI